MEEIVISIAILVLTAILSLAIGLISIGPLLDYLKQKLIGQYIREDGPQGHLSKKGTPTMGGIAIIGSVVITSFVIMFYTNMISLEMALVMVIALAFAALGFSDDYFKVMKKHNKGVTGWTKLAIQILLGALVGLFVFYVLGRSSVSVFGLAVVNLGLLYIPFAILVIVSCSNSINLTDGLDGLAALTCVVSFLTLAFFLYKTGSYGLAVVSVAVAGSCLGFLAYNLHPAKIFMGDVGSLALGGLFGMLGVLGGLELWLILIGLVFVFESLSVIIQVISFKSTGKRVFKMTPLHHHFELSGDKEPVVVIKFYFLQLIACMISIILGYMWLF
jgi:phospho-N-acetylmuramoyl-pentapeptide-transferase